ncbi:MAG: hypothetical protein IIC83_12790 [Chloroflexi bacterium]|nr:hypothetical protein [Chloroflexota bacterium]MCH7652517.1 hypothetical protein [Chloroflexota bacterium]MCH9010989.1 hypothetical protein [Chloroflexota bacterium]
MNEDSRRRVLDLLSEGKISVDEAERLLSLAGNASSRRSERNTRRENETTHPPKYLRVVVEPGSQAGAEESGERVNLRVPMALIRAGMRLPALIPGGVADKVNEALRENGIDLDVRRLDGDELDKLISALSELEIDVENGEHKVKVFVE